MSETVQLFPDFSGPVEHRALNLLVNGNPITFGIRSLFATQPQLMESLGEEADTILRIQDLPPNLFRPERTPSEPLQVGDRVTGTNRQWPGSEKFGGYILAINEAGGQRWALVMWDFVPTGPLTYDPVSNLNPQPNI